MMVLFSQTTGNLEALLQCIDHGDASYAIKAGLIVKEQLIEVGAVIKNPESGRTDEHQITVADLTGVAVQDIQIANLAYESLTSI